MKPTLTKAVLTVAVAAAMLTGCAATTTTTTSDLFPVTATTTPAATATPVEPAVPVDPLVKAAEDSGLTTEAYAELTARAVDIDASIADTDPFLAAIDALGVEYGKPIAIVTHYKCPKNDVIAWGISGALYGTAPPGCGTGYAESREGTLEKVEQRATREKSWTPADYILVFIDTVG